MDGSASIETGMLSGDTEADPSTEVEEAIENETEEGGLQVLEAQRKGLEKTAKISCGLALSLPVAIIIAVIDNMNKPDRTRCEQIILYKASTAFALLSFLAGLGLLISVHKNVTRTTVLLGLIIIAVISVLAGVLLLAINAVI